MGTGTELLYKPSSNGASAEKIRVRCVGPTPEWLSLPEAVEALNGIDMERVPTNRRAALRRRSPDAFDGAPQVCHVTHSELRCLPALRDALPFTSLVLDLSEEGESGLGRREARRAGKADSILVGSVRELRELRRRYPLLAPRTSLFRRPIDLERFAPESALGVWEASEVGRLREAHSLVGQLVLFAGPFTEEGGLDLAIEAVREVQRRNPAVRLAALAEGRIDRRFLERCRKGATQIGSASLLRETASGEERCSWYRAAHVVCLPCREAAGALPAKLAAAAGKPFVGFEVEPLLEHVDDGETGYLLPATLETLTAALEALIGDEEESRRMGVAARRKAEEELSPSAAARKLVGLWADAA